MITVKKVLEKPDDLEEQLTEYSLKTIKLFPRLDLVFRCMKRCWRIDVNGRLAIVFGYIDRQSFIGSKAEIWLLLGAGVADLRLSDWRLIRRAFRRVINRVGTLAARCEEDYHAGNKLIQSFGFVKTQTFDGYNFYEVR